MTVNIVRSLGAVVLSLITALALLAAVEGISALLHPYPQGFGGTPDEMIQHVANYPPVVLFLLGGLGWGAVMVICTWLATRLGTRRHPAHGVGVGLVLLAAALFNISMLPYPAWFLVVTLIILPLGIFFGTRLGIGKPTVVSGA